MKARIYITGYGQQARLVRAQSRTQALDFVSKGIINVMAVKKDELVDLLAKGMKIEDATGGETQTLEM